MSYFTKPFYDKLASNQVAISLLYDLNLLPETVDNVDDARKAAAVVAHLCQNADQERDAERFRALEAELSNKGHHLSTMLASLDYKYDCPETLAELADKLIAEMKEVGK